MSPQSLLYLPVDLLQAAPHDGAPTSNAEGPERRAALVALAGVALALLLMVGAALPGARRPPCAAPGHEASAVPDCAVRS